MSMKSWTEQGFGYQLLNDNNFETVKQFILDNAELSEDERDDLIDSQDSLEAFDAMNENMASVVASIINRVEDFDLFDGYDEDGDTDQELMLGIRPGYPWYFSEHELISADQARSLLKKWGERLGITVNPDYFEAEYYG